MIVVLKPIVSNEALKIKIGDKIMLQTQDCFREIVKTELREDTIRVWFKDGESAVYCADGEVSAATNKKYFHNIKLIDNGSLVQILEINNE